jgi:colanic acid/amylovoran biosynthesis glycosyltransferase
MMSEPKDVSDPSSLLLVTHVPMRQGPRGLQIDDQTAAGIAQWCKHFGRVTFLGVLDRSEGGSSTNWVDLSDYPAAQRCTAKALPWAYGPAKMLRGLGKAHSTLAEAISQHNHLCFTIGGIVGDWPAVAAMIAIVQGRRYAAWVDRIEPLIVRNKLNGAPLKRRAMAALALPVIEQVIRHILRKSSVALLQGRDTFDFYSGVARDANCTYDTHTHPSDQIDAAQLAAKRQRIIGGAPLRILYVGRAAAMKGPVDWLETLARLRQQGTPYKARWIGDGPLLKEMKARVAALGLEGQVHLLGFEDNRDVLLAAMRDSDLLMFCHKTLESPRCLIEALVSGCPLVGYDTAYPRGLVEARGGAALSARDDVDALAATVDGLHRDRRALAALVTAAAASGELYNEDAVYAHRANLMKRG